MKRLIKYSFFTVIFSWPFLAVILAILSFNNYNRLSSERPIAIVRFSKESDLNYIASIKLLDNLDINGQQIHTYNISGDQWRIDAEFIKMKPWANIIGFDSRYKLDRLQGRYSNIKLENSRLHTAHEFTGNKMLASTIPYNFLIDAEYGSSSYKKISPNKEFTIYVTQSGIIIKESALRK